jgi:DNA-binding GntR family transcriptional regulator
MKNFSKSSEERAYRGIIEMILSQELPPGTPIMESFIVEKLEMSRTPIRSALRRLSSSGLLEISANKSASVPILSKKDWDDIFELRLMVEPRIAELAAAQYSKNKGTFFLDIIEDEKKGAQEGGTSMQTLNERLHFGIAELSGNKYMFRSLQQVFWRCQLYICFFDSFLQKKPRNADERIENPLETKSISQHELMVKAILEKDSSLAGRLMREHIMSTYERASKFAI